MELKIVSIYLKNFKGVKENSINFYGDSAKVLGANGTGKSTLSDAMYWVFCDMNTALTKNPPVTPLGMPECESKVEIELELDGSRLTVAKVQKFKSKEVDGKITSKVDNFYEINSVEKTLRDFVADLNERGINMDEFLIFSHPSAFTNDTSKSGREKMRTLLFRMCEGITDKELAETMSGVDELSGLLDTYKVAEIEQMNKATIKKISDAFGKDNSIINARIDELYSQMSDKDIDVLNQQKLQCGSEIARIDKELSNIASAKAERTTELAKLKAEKEKLIIDANADLVKGRADIDKQTREVQHQLTEFQYQKKEAESQKSNILAKLERYENDIEKQRNLYKVEMDSVIDESSLECPVCHRPYDADKAEVIKADFEQNKAKRLETIKRSGADLKAEIDAENTHLASVENKLEKIDIQIEELNKSLYAISEQADALPDRVDMSGNAEYIALVDKINNLTEDLSKDDLTRKEELESQKNVNKQLLSQIQAEIGVVDKNAEIKERIEQLKSERQLAEINKAKAEKILNQVERFKLEKNTKLTERINANFEGVEFRLFKTLKNGSVEDALDVLIDGKEINTQLNQASQVLAKLNIINGLSKYFNIHLPVFVDDASLLTSNTVSKIDINNQLIFLCASDAHEKLYVEYI